LGCLEKSYQIASEFDSRPGLKFLVQKVARADVATNLYKQTGISLTFLLHTLIEICAYMDDVCLDTTRRFLKEQKDTPQANNQAVAAEDLHKILLSTPDYEVLTTSSGSLKDHAGVMIRRLKVLFDEVCRVYVDLYLDREGPSKADELSTSVLVFLLTHDDDLPQLKREKSLKEMVAEKLKGKRKKKSEDEPGLTPINMQPQGLDSQQTVVQQDVFEIQPMQPEPGTQENDDKSPVKDRPHPEQEDKVYSVVTDKGLRSMMSEYKKRKQAHTMPTFVKQTRSKPKPVKKREECQ